MLVYQRVDACTHLDACFWYIYGQAPSFNPGSKIGLKTTVDEEPIPKLKTLSVVSN